MEGLIDWLKNHMFTCPSKNFFYFDCPGCGLQRSLVALFEGDFGRSFHLYPATIPILFCLIFTALHIMFRFKNGALIIKCSYVFATLTIVVFYVYKIFTHQLIYYGK